MEQLQITRVSLLNDIPNCSRGMTQLVKEKRVEVAHGASIENVLHACLIAGAIGSGRQRETVPLLSLPDCRSNRFWASSSGGVRVLC